MCDNGEEIPEDWVNDGEDDCETVQMSTIMAALMMITMMKKTGTMMTMMMITMMKKTGTMSQEIYLLQ